MALYLVRWEIDIFAENPQEAAEKAREVQMRPGSWATVFEILEPEALMEPRKPMRRIATIDLSYPERSRTYETDGASSGG